MTIAVERAPDRPVTPSLLRYLPRASVLIGVLAFLVYLVPAVRVLQLNPDVVEYIDVARRLVAGEGYLLGVKAYHVGGTAVLHDGLSERAPLYPLIVAAVLRLGLDLRALQVINAALAAVAVALVAEIGLMLFGRRVGAASGLLAAASPLMLARLVPPMSEAIAISLTVAAVWLALRGTRSNPHSDALPGGEGGGVRANFLLCGLALGLAYLARPTTLALAVGLLAAVVAVGHDRASALRGVGWAVLGLLACVVPMSLYTFATRGSLSYSGQSYLYSVYKDSDVLRNGYGRPIPPAAEFISQNLDFVRVAILENVRDYAYLILTDNHWLLPLAPAWIGVIWVLARRRYPREALIPAAVAAVNSAVYAATWANFQERYQIVTLLLLLPLLVHGLDQVGLGRVRLGPLPDGVALFAAVAVVALWWSPTFRQEYRNEFRYGDDPVGTRVDDAMRWTGPPRWVQDNELSRIDDWIEEHTERNDVLTHGQPWPYTFFTGRPATLLPTKLTSEALRTFLTDYRVAYVLLDQRDRDRRDYRDGLEALQDEGVTVTTLGSFRIYDTRPLWNP
jgi:hypothetical protein